MEASEDPFVCCVLPPSVVETFCRTPEVELTVSFESLLLFARDDDSVEEENPDSRRFAEGATPPVDECGRGGLGSVRSDVAEELARYGCETLESALLEEG